MKAVFQQPMNPRLVWLAGAILLSSGGIYCVIYSGLSGRPDGLGIGVKWAAVSLLPWLLAFEVGKRVNYEPAGTWRVSWWWIAAVLAITAAVSVALQDWLWADGQYSARETALAALRRIPPALLIGLLLFLVPMFQDKAELERADPPSAGMDQLPLLPRQIDWIKASGNYLEIKTGRRLILHRMTMASAEELLKNHNFIRVHRSALINADRVKELDRGKLADEIVLEDGIRLKVGGAYRPLVAQALGQRSSRERLN